LLVWNLEGDDLSWIARGVFRFQVSARKGLTTEDTERTEVEWWELFDFEKFISAQGLIGEADSQ
jgi:hypothetical protein